MRGWRDLARISDGATPRASHATVRSVIILPDFARQHNEHAAAQAAGEVLRSFISKRDRQEFLVKALRGLPAALRDVAHHILAAGAPESRERRVASRQSAHPSAAFADTEPQTHSVILRELDRLGVLIATNLHPAIRLALESAGAAIVTDEVVDLSETLATASSKPSEIAERPWHLALLDTESSTSPRGAKPGSGVSIGFLDSGIDAAHPEFHGRNIAFCVITPSGARSWAKAHDVSSHGTFIASVAAGRLRGFAAGAEIIMASVMDSTLRTSTVRIVAGLTWLLDELAKRGNRPAIINASLIDPSLAAAYEAPLRRASSEEVLVLAAAGNRLPGIAFTVAPARFRDVLAVGATDRRDQLAPFSLDGVFRDTAGTYTKPDLCAPGVEVIGALPGGGFGVSSGTSIATAIVSGVAARTVADARRGVTPAAASASILRRHLIGHVERVVLPAGRLAHAAGAGRIRI